MKQLNKACFLDRDGVIIEEKNYLSTPSDVHIFPQAIEALTILKSKGYKVIVVTNQGGVARGYYKEEDIINVHKEIDRQLNKFFLNIDKYYYCPHYPDGSVKEYVRDCTCRKPSPGMILAAINEFSIDLRESFLIGDKISDIDAAQKAGCFGIMVKTGHGIEFEEKAIKKGIIVKDNILEAVNYFVSRYL